MKKLVIFLTLFLVLSCTTEILEQTTEEVTIDQKPTTYCDIKLLEMDCWIINSDQWETLDLSGIIGSRSSVKLELRHIGGDTTEYVTFGFRESVMYREITMSAFYEQVYGTVTLTTDVYGKIQYRNKWGADEGRKIRIELRLKQY